MRCSFGQYSDLVLGRMPSAASPAPASRPAPGLGVGRRLESVMRLLEQEGLGPYFSTEASNRSMMVFFMVLNPFSIRRGMPTGVLRRCRSGACASCPSSVFRAACASRDVAAVALGRHVLAHGLDRFAGDDLGADGGLYGDVELLARDQLLELSRTSCVRNRRRGP